MSLKYHLRRLSSLDLSQEYTCLNALQGTSWSINRELLEVMTNLWEGGQAWAGLPAREDIPLPDYPFDRDPKDLSDEDREAFRIWSRRRNEIYSTNNRTISKRVQVERTLQVAKDYNQYEEFFYVWQNDFRSRKYASSTFMSPQGADWSKSLMRFTYSMPIKNWDDARWLCIHGANLYGNDKVTLDQRETWAWNFVDEVNRIVANPYDYTLWTEADKPFQFLAWCFEFAALNRQGWGYESTLPVAVDGSCNGLQHLSAILRDERGGYATNLVPTDSPQDIYQQVADETVAKLKQDDTELARKCLAFGINRKLTKRPVMIVPYSGTRHACRAYIQEAMKERIHAGEENIFGDDCFEASSYLAKYVWEAIADVIQAASSVMAYVKEIGEAYAEQNKYMEWITPTGWLVLQQYNQTQKKRIKTHLSGEILTLTYLQDKENSVNKRRTGLGSSPNFIHSLDAAAMTKTINKASGYGIKDYAMVHDSYGTHTTMMPLLSEILREEFVKMYEEHDVLDELRTHAMNVLGTSDLPHPPTSGTLDLQRVLESPYFFA